MNDEIIGLTPSLTLYMRTRSEGLTRWIMAHVMVLLVAGTVRAGNLSEAINKGNFTEYFGNAAAWLNKKAPADPGKVSEDSMKALLRNKAFVLVLHQRELIARVGVEKFGGFARGNRANRSFLAGFMGSSETMDTYLEGGKPRDNEYVGSLNVLRKILAADPDARKGLYLKLACATALAQAKPNTCFGSDEAIDPVKRYLQYRTAYRNNELDPMFPNLSVWELEKVVGSWASDADLVWAREMLRTMRPELVIEKRYVRQVSEVQYRRADFGPRPYTFATVLAKGGKCGPRAWFGRMINQAFGVPVWGVKQPGHAAVGFLGNIGWKVKYGRGWDKSRWGGMSGHQFLELATAREHRVDFSQAEHLRWLANALTSQKLAAAVRGAAEHIQKHPKGPRTENRLKDKRPFRPRPETPYTPVRRVQRLWASQTANRHNAWTQVSYSAGTQLYFQKNKEGWAEYKVNIPRGGRYGLTTRYGSTCDRCCFYVVIDGKAIGEMRLRNTKGFWGESKARVLDLPKTGILRFVFPHQRGVAVKWFELRKIANVPRAEVGDGMNLGARVDASSEECDKRNLVENLVDGDPKTRWAASTGSMPQWVVVNLGRKRFVRKTLIN